MPNNAYSEIRTCRICGNPHLELVLDLGQQALTGVFPKTRTSPVANGPLQLAKCVEDARGTTCGLLQLRHSFNPDDMYRGNYGYRSGINQLMVRHLQHLVKNILDWVTPTRGDVVLDIGCNDSTLLQAYPRHGQTLLGIDPSAVNFRQYYPPDIQLVTDYFTGPAYRSVMGQHPAKVVTSIAMFYDLPAPLEFVKDVKSILAPDGIWVLEQSYLPSMLEQNAYDTVCHEHLEYYALRQLKWMTDRVGLKILDVEFNDINGGSFCVTIAHETAPYLSRADVATILERESQLGLATLKPYLAFRERVERHREALPAQLREINQRGELILGYGASTKGNVVLQYCGLTSADLPAIAERNPEKFGCFTPGSLIPIISEEDARTRRPRYLMPLPWHFREDFLKREAAFLDGGGKFLFPLPQIEVFGR